MKRGVPIILVLAVAIGGSPVGAATPALTPAPISVCADLSGEGLQDMRGSAAGPYLLSEPATVDESTATVIFLPGGGGSPGAASLTWESFFGSGDEFDDLRVIIPYADDGNLFTETARTFAILDEVLSCEGGDPMQVHLAGTSNGGVAAFGLMLAQPHRFATLLGAPGLFPVEDPAGIDPVVLAETFEGRAVFDGVGELDENWQPGVIATHNALTAAGVESVFAEFPGEGHIPGPGFDNSALLEFWGSH